MSQPGTEGTSNHKMSYGSDVIVDLLKQAGITHVALNPGASFRGIHDSLVHTAGAPDTVLCLHEAVAVGVAQGYVKAAGKPMAVLLHNVVGLQNASMAIYNAWCDRAAMLLIGGTGPKSKKRRRPWIDWIHTASVQGTIVRDYVAWDDEPHDLHSVPESFARGLSAATSAPPAPVYLCYDVDLQEDPIGEDFAPSLISAFAQPTDPAMAASDVTWLAQALCGAARPVFLAGYVGEGDEAFAAFAKLAELCGAAVIDTGVRHAIATSHPLCASGIPQLVADADLIVAFDVENLAGPLRESSADVVNISVSHLKLRGWAHDYQSLIPATRHFTATADSAVRDLLIALHQNPPNHQDVANRSETIADGTREARSAWRQHASTATADGVIPLERMLFEVGEALKSENFVLTNGTNQRLEQRLWSMEHPRQYLGWHAGGGLGYGAAATIGASIALGKETICVDIQADGDLLFLPSALWTAVRASTPTLFVVNNNRQYGNTVEHAQKIGATRGHGDARRYEAAGLTDPIVDLAGMARSFGMWAQGPITDSDHLAEQLTAAVKIVRSGRPALLDVLTPGF